MWNSGKCCALGLPKILENESEILTVSELPANTSFNEEEETDLDSIYDELETMKQKLLTLRSKLIITPMDKCQQKMEKEEQEEQEDSVDEMLTPVQQQLNTLRRQNCILRCQLHEMAKHLYATRKDIEEYKALQCQLTQNLQKFCKELKIFDAFKANAIHHFGLCIERWEQHKNSKILAKTFMDMMCKFRISSTGMHRGHVTLNCHQQVRNDAIMELVLIRVLLCHIYETLMDNFNFFARRMSSKCVPSP
uniref:GK19399 n=1 Tax=Drosophila willistoni TaxID=7260 RepID=B4MPX2_DROWI